MKLYRVTHQYYQNSSAHYQLQGWPLVCCNSILCIQLLFENLRQFILVDIKMNLSEVQVNTALGLFSIHCFNNFDFLYVRSNGLASYRSLVMNSDIVQLDGLVGHNLCLPTALIECKTILLEYTQKLLVGHLRVLVCT